MYRIRMLPTSCRRHDRRWSRAKVDVLDGHKEPIIFLAVNSLQEVHMFLQECPAIQLYRSLLNFIRIPGKSLLPWPLTFFARNFVSDMASSRLSRDLWRFWELHPSTSLTTGRSCNAAEDLPKMAATPARLAQRAPLTLVVLLEAFVEAGTAGPAGWSR